MKILRFLSLFSLGFCLWGTTLVAVHVELSLLPSSEIERLTQPELESLESVYHFFMDNVTGFADGDLNSSVGLDLSTKLLHSSTMHCLRECFCSQFSRGECSCFRNGLVKFLMRNILAKHPDKAQPLTYVSVGSGRLFLDVILVTMLMLYGYKNIHVFLIDRVYSGHFSAERRPPAITQFIQWVSFLSLKIPAQVMFTMGDDACDIQPEFADVVVAADLDIPEEDALNSVILACLSMLKANGIYGFLADKPLMRFVGLPLIEQEFKIYRQSFLAKPHVILSLGLYVGCKGEPSRDEPLIRLSAREAVLLDVFGVLVPRIC